MKRLYSTRLRLPRCKSRRLRLEGLEQRQLLAADGLSLAADVVDVDQNSDPITIQVLANDSFDSDYVGDRRITSVSTGSLGGRIEISDDGGSLRYAPPADGSGTELFRYTVDDRQFADVTVNIVSPLLNFEVTIDQFQSEYRFDLLSGARFPESYSGQKRITLISETAQSSDARISEDGQSVIYRNENNIAGKDSFTYIVDDLYVATAVINVHNPLKYDVYEVLQNSDTANLDVLENDFRLSEEFSNQGVVSEAQWASIRSAARITHVLDVDPSEVTIAADGRSLDFTPAENAYGSRYFRYVVDGRFEQTVTVRIQRPVVNDFLVADINGGVHSLDVLQNDEYRSIFTNGPIRVVQRVTAVTQGDQGGTLGINASGTAVLYTPADGFAGTETFEYVADEKYRATVSVSVTQPVRDDYATVYLHTATPIDVLENDFASDASKTAEITSVTESRLGGTIVVGSNGAIRYTPPEDLVDGDLADEDLVDYESDTFEYTVNDQYTATVVLSLREPTDSDSYDVDRPVAKVLYVLSNDHFGPNYLGEARITAVSDPSGGGTVTISSTGKYLNYQPGSSYESFTYTVDDRFTEMVRIRPIPRLNADTAVADQNGPAVKIDVLANDFSSNRYGTYLGQRVLSADSESEQGGTVVVTEDGKVSYVPPTDFVGRDSFSYTVDDFLSQTVRVNVVRRAADDVVRVAPNSQANSLNVLANDIHGADYSGAGLISQVTASAAGGQVAIADDRGSILYTPPAGFTGEDTFVYTIDGQSKATVTVSVHNGASDRIGKFESTDQFRDFLLELALTRYKNQFGNRDYGSSLYDGYERNLAVADAAGGVQFSETNVQVAGVDEHDIVETDGFFIYTLRGNELTIVKSLPADELELVSRIEIEGSPVGMYLNGDRVTVISQSTTDLPVPLPRFDFVSDRAFTDIVYPYPIPVPSTTIVTVLDVADRGAPQIVQRTEFDGRFQDSRRIDDQVFLVLQSDAVIPELESTCDEDKVCTFETEQEFTERVLADFAVLIEDTLPGYESYDGSGDLVRGGPLLMPEDIFRSNEEATTMTIVASINMASSEPGLSAVSGVMSESGNKIYASATSLYVFRDYFETVEHEQWTEILKFDWNGQSGAIEFAATGNVPGSMLNQFSADESDGLLRVTTEVSNSGTGNFSGDAETGVFLLSEDEGVLEFVGSLQNLAVGQSIKSVRYFGDRAFVTTFDHVDPLNAIDLSDPANPQALGHVPIPGFSSYMQFVSPDRLLTIGTNTATGFGGRAMVSLFDVTDLTSPSLIDQYNLPKFSTSEANSDHHAFGWFANHELLSVPTSRHFSERYDADEDGYKEAYRLVREDELSVLHVGVDENGGEGISARGQVLHQAKVLRSVSINDFVYSVGLDGIRAVHVGDAGTVVDEVIFDWAIIEDDHPWVPIDHGVIGSAARDVLADAKNLDRGGILLVTQERRDGGVELVLRSGDQHYRVRGTSESDLALVDEAFAFAKNLRHNAAKPLDANGDGNVTASDALMVINEISRQVAGNSAVDQVLRQVSTLASRFTDTNGDGHVTAVDALRIINDMARRQVRAPVAAERISSPVDTVFRDDEELGRLF